MTGLEIEQHLHAGARAYVEILKDNGVPLSKKRLRFNEVVEVGFFYGRCGNTFNLSAAEAGVLEAVDACRIGSQSETEGSVINMIQMFMVSCEDPRQDKGNEDANI